MVPGEMGAGTWHEGGEAGDNVTDYMLGIYGRTPRASDFSHAFLPTSDWPLQAGMFDHISRELLIFLEELANADGEFDHGEKATIGEIKTLLRHYNLLHS